MAQTDSNVSKGPAASIFGAETLPVTNSELCSYSMLTGFICFSKSTANSLLKHTCTYCLSLHCPEHLDCCDILYTQRADVACSFQFPNHRRFSTKCLTVTCPQLSNATVLTIYQRNPTPKSRTERALRIFHVSKHNS
jgi:hypothetical protein